MKPFIIYSTDLFGSKLGEMLDRLSVLEPEVIAVHAEISDKRDMTRIEERSSIVKGCGSALGLATHMLGSTIPWVEKADVPVELILAPLNSIGYAMKPSFERSLEAIQSSSRRVVAIKPLAAGRIKPREAFEFIYRYVLSLAVGVASEMEMKETYEAATIAYKERKTGGL